MVYTAALGTHHPLWTRVDYKGLGFRGQSEFQLFHPGNLQRPWEMILSRGSHGLLVWDCKMTIHAPSCHVSFHETAISLKAGLTSYWWRQSSEGISFNFYFAIRGGAFLTQPGAPMYSRPPALITHDIDIPSKSVTSLKGCVWVYSYRHPL